MLGIHRFSLTAAAWDASGCECGQVSMAILPLGVVSWAGVVWERGVKMELTVYSACGSRQACPYHISDSNAPPSLGLSHSLRNPQPIYLSSWPLLTWSLAGQCSWDIQVNSPWHICTVIDTFLGSHSTQAFFYPWRRGLTWVILTLVLQPLFFQYLGFHSCFHSTSRKAYNPTGRVPGPTSPSQKTDWGEEVPEQSTGLLTNHLTSEENWRKDVGRLSREKLHILYSLLPGSEDEVN